MADQLRNSKGNAWHNVFVLAFISHVARYSSIVFGRSRLDRLLHVDTDQTRIFRNFANFTVLIKTLSNAVVLINEF